MQEKLSIWIPTKNRPFFLLRLLEYYKNTSFKGCLLIGDSSNGKFLEKNKQSDFINKNDIEKQENEPSNYEEMVKLFKTKGELLIHAKLTSCVHLVSFEKGKIDIRVTGNTDKGFTKEISNNLTKWTGFDWVVNSVEEEGEETLDQKREREDKERISMTKSTPEMEKVLKAFPNADLKSVKDSNV